MKKHVLGTAVAVALGTAASSAFAFDARTVVPDYEVVWAGATASTTTVRNWIIDNICSVPAVAPIDVFRRANAVGTFTNDWGIACVPRTTLGTSSITAGKKVLFRKRDVGGSGTGVTPVQHPIPAASWTGTNFTGGPAPTAGDAVNGSTTAAASGFQLAIQAVNNITCPNLPTSVPTPTAIGTFYNEYKCTGVGDEMRVPDGGFSDIEGNKFFGLNQPAGFPNYLKPASGLAEFPFGALVFNTPVTKDLRTALQAVQFDIASSCNPAGVAWSAVDAETEKCMPSLTSMEIRSLFTGGIKTFDSFLVDSNGPAAGEVMVPLKLHPNVVTAATNLRLTIPTDQKVQVCRRVAGSGTQAQFNAIFTNWPCDLDAATTTSSALLAGPIVFSNSGSSDVGRCLADFNDGSNTGTNINAAGVTVANNPGLNPVKRWGIGIQSTENNVGNPLNYRFIKVNGYEPTIHSVHAGDYEDYAEQSCQSRNNGNLFNTKGVAVHVTDTKTILDYVCKEASTPADLASVNTAYVHTWGQGGWLAVPTAASAGGNQPSYPFSLANPVNSNTRSYRFGIPNTCNFPNIIKKVQVDSNISKGDFLSPTSGPNGL